MDEKSVCANIEKLTQQLNGELRAAAELGLNVKLETSARFSNTTAKQISVRVWRETEMVNVPNGTLGPNWTKWPVEAQIKLRDYLRERLPDENK